MKPDTFALQVSNTYRISLAIIWIRFYGYFVNWSKYFTAIHKHLISSGQEKIKNKGRPKKISLSLLQKLFWIIYKI